MTMLEIRHLRYAIAVAEEGHMTRAAERLGIQQPPLSQQIKTLEALVGSPLFRRLPRGMEMTDAGRAFVERARQVLADLDATVDAARRAARGETGALAVGFTSSAAFHPLVSSVFRGLRQALPDLALRLEEGATDELTGDLLAGRLDAAFIRSASDTQPSLVIDHVDTEEMLLAIPDVHPLAHPSQRKHRIALADLSEDVFILYRRPSGQGLYDRIIAACQRAGFSPRIAQEAPKMVSTLSLVAAGLGASIIPESMARLETSGVVYRRFTQSSGLVAPLYLALRRDGEAGALARFVEEVQRNVKSPRQAPSSP
jgi:DNA-binding transcriptional LysR family regulator